MYQANPMYIDFIIKAAIPCSACIKFSFTNQGVFLAAVIRTKDLMIDWIYSVLLGLLFIVVLIFVRDIDDDGLKQLEQSDIEPSLY